MADRNPGIPHSIQSLLYVERRGKYCGYKLELINGNIGSRWEKFLICSQCKGISRKARQVGANTICEMCVIGTAGNIDERVENKVLYINSKCPLSGNGCDWEGVLGEIEQHMEVCLKVLVKCELECGIVFERENTEQHNKEECPLRKKECQYCRIEIQVKEENQHIGKCTNHPDTEVPCLYKELGCDAIVLRRNKDIHLAENMIGHEKVMLDQLSQLRNRNRQLEQQQNNLNEEQRNRIGTIGMSVTEREREHRNNMDTLLALINKVKKKWRLSIICSILISITIIIIITTAISIPVVVVFNAQYSSQQSNLQKIKSDLQKINYSIDSNQDSIQSNSELIQSQLANIEYVYDYNKTTGRARQGIEWIQYLHSMDDNYGPIFYLDKCKLVLEEQVPNYDPKTNRVVVQYYVTRLEDEQNGDCKITYINSTVWNLKEMQPLDKYKNDQVTNLDVGGFIKISNEFEIGYNTKIRLTVYFDTKED